jgi:hypothetical protein
MISDIERYSDDCDREDGLEEELLSIGEESTQCPPSETESIPW